MAIYRLNMIDIEKKEMKVLKDDLKRFLIFWQLFKSATEQIRTSEVIKQWAIDAKQAKNKSFIDFRSLAANQINGMNVMLLKMKGVMKGDTWNIINTVLTSEQVKEIDLLLDEIIDMKDFEIEQITNEIKLKKNAK